MKPAKRRGLGGRAPDVRKAHSNGRKAHTTGCEAPARNNAPKAQERKLQGLCPRSGGGLGAEPPLKSEVHMFRLFSLLIGYAFGCIHSAYVVGKLAHGIDIREHGSKNSGFTNANRVMGFKTGVWIFLADVAKAVLAFLVAGWLFEGGGGFFAPYAANGLLPGVWAGIGAVIGHCFPVILKFKGGKGIACTVGLLLMLDWRAAIIIFAIAIILILVTRYVSLASLVITLLIPIFMAVFGHGWEVVAVTAVLMAVAWFMHRGNIQRLVTGSERRFSFTKKPDAP